VVDGGDDEFDEVVLDGLVGDGVPVVAGKAGGALVELRGGFL
jgi:hypothetical protein